MRRIKSNKEQESIYTRLISTQRKLFRHAEKYDEGAGVTLQDYKPVSQLGQYHLNVRLRGPTLGVFLWGPSFRDVNRYEWILGLATMTPKGGVTAGLLIEDDGGYFLLHDGRVYNVDNRGNPYFLEPKIEVDGREYFMIGRIDSSDFFPRIVEYHESRLNLDLRNRKAQPVSKKHVGLDPGISKGGTRTSVIVEAHHSPIVSALYLEMQKKRFVLGECESRPDLYLVKGSEKVIFEVKPFARLHDLTMACGQLILYNEEINADIRVIITQEVDFSNTFLGRLMERAAIRIVEYKKEGSKIIFFGLNEALKMNTERGELAENS